MNKKILFILMMVGIVIASGCPGPEPEPFIPSVDITLDKSSVSFSDNSISEFVTATITRQDTGDIGTVIVMKLLPEKSESIYPVDSAGKKIDELSTKPLKGQNAKDTLQFKVAGTKSGYSSAASKINIEFWWNNTKLEGKDKTIDVVIK